MSIHDYFDSVTRVVMSFQHLEVSLKFYIRDCDKIIQESVKNKFHYSVRENEMEKMPLGKLIEEFSRRSDKEQWVKGMKKLNRTRNYFAHQAYLLTIEEQEDSGKLKAMAERANKINKIVAQCIRDIASENSRIKGEEFDSAIMDEWINSLS